MMEKYIFLNLWIIRVIGVWYPEKTSSSEVKIYSFLRSLTVASLLFILIPAVIVAQDYLRRYDLSKNVEVLTLMISASVILCKTINMILRRNQIRILLKKMSNFWELAVSNNEVKALTGFAEIGKKVTKYYVILGFFSVISFIGQPFLSSYLSGSENSTTFIVNRLPFDGWENLLIDNHSTVLFALVFASQVVAGILASIASIGHDCLFVVLIFHVCANLRALAKTLRNLDLSNDVGIEEKIKRCAKTFENLAEYTKELDDMLSLYLLAQSICSTMIICLTSYLVSRDINSNKELFKYISYWSAALFQLFTFCWAANYLQTEANMIGRSAYDVYGKLMNLDLKNHERHRHLLTKIPRSYLQMILLRSQFPLNITAGNFYEMSLENCRKLLSTSYSYFTILRAFADKKI